MAEIKFEKVVLVEDDSLVASDCFMETLAKAMAEATKRGIKANSIVINKNMVHVPERFGEWPEMICGLHCYFTDKELPDGYSFAVFRDANRVEKPAQGFGEWISVEERMPKELQTVIIYNGDVDVAYYGYGYFETIDQYETYIIDGVTHWMPLPEPPKV